MSPNPTIDPVGKALWFIESHFDGEITLDDVAAASGVSRYHLTRAFGTATGYPVMRYLRGRRLSEAARALCNGAPGILSVALDAGYGSHEAFTRAFREQFGVTPESVRERRDLRDLDLINALRREEEMMTTIQEPRIETSRVLLLGGLMERYPCKAAEKFPQQWQRFSPYIGQIRGQVGSVAYGVCLNPDDDGNIDYFTAVELTSFENLPKEFTHLRLPERRYAVFTHRDHISGIRRTWDAALSDWLPRAGLTMADAPDFERYDERFDPRTGNGEVEIWIPVTS